MAIQPLLTQLAWPSFPPRGNAAALSFSSTALTSAGNKQALIFRPPKAGTITKVAFRNTGVTSSGNADIRLETVDAAATGDPTGTLFATNTNGTQTISTANTWWTTTLTAGAVVARTDIIAAVIVNTTGNYSISTLNTATFAAVYPYADVNTGSWAKATSLPCMAFEYNDGSYEYIPGVLPFATLNSTNFNSGSNPEIRGLKFRVPVSVRLAGFWLYQLLGGDADIKLYDSDGTTVLSTVSLDKDIRGSSGAAGFYQVLFPATQTLLANTFYRVAIVPTSVTNVTYQNVDVDSVAVMAAMDGGPDFHDTTNHLGTWTDNTVRRPFMGILVDGIDSGGGPGHLWTPVQGRGRLAA